MALPSQYPEVAAGSAAQRLLSVHIDMQFQDLRTMLLLPQADQGLTGGMNLATFAVLTNLIGGFAEWFAPEEHRVGADDAPSRGRSEAIWRAFVQRYYPQSVTGPMAPLPTLAARLYDARNAFAHTMALPETKTTQKLGSYSMIKAPLSHNEIDVLDAAEEYPLDLWPLRFLPKQRHLNVFVPGLYWATVCMLRAALADHGASWEPTADFWLKAMPQPTPAPEK